MYVMKFPITFNIWPLTSSSRNHTSSPCVLHCCWGGCPLLYHPGVWGWLLLRTRWSASGYVNIRSRRSQGVPRYKHHVLTSENLSFRMGFQDPQRFDYCNHFCSSCQIYVKVYFPHWRLCIWNILYLVYNVLVTNKYYSNYWKTL